MSELTEGMTNADGKVECNRCEAIFVVYFEDSTEVAFCPSCGVVASSENVTYKDC